MDGLFSSEMDLGRVAARLALAGSLGLLVALVHRLTSRGRLASPMFAQGLVACSMLLAAMMMAVGDSLARSFGLLGAVSLVRFRTPVKDMRDLVFILYAVAMGVSAGVGAAGVAVFGGAFIGAALVLLDRAQALLKTRIEYGLTLVIASKAADACRAAVEEALRRRGATWRRESVRALGVEGLELTYQAALAGDDGLPGLLAELQATPGVQHVSLATPVSELDLQW
jgi:hypothetical protein